MKRIAMRLIIGLMLVGVVLKGETVRKTCIPEAVNMLMNDEGYSKLPYKDNLGILHIGYGFNLEVVGLSIKESTIILRLRVDDIEAKLFSEFEWFRPLDLRRQSVIISMVYQMGFNDFKSFKKMIKALADKDYDLASEEGLDSLWSLQTPTRAIRHMEVLRRG